MIQYVTPLVAEEYDMNHIKRGIALILNHHDIKGVAKREGTQIDCARVKAELIMLSFDVIIQNDLILWEINFTSSRLENIFQLGTSSNIAFRPSTL